MRNSFYMRDDHQGKDELRLKFSVVSNNHELLSKLDRALKDEGIVRLATSNREIHYLVDARYREQAAIACIQSTKDSYLYQMGLQQNTFLQEANRIVDRVLSQYAFDRGIKGYLFLRYCLLQALLDESVLLPVSKSLYPLAANHFGVSFQQVGRNLRYLFEKLYYKEQTLVQEGGTVVLREGEAEEETKRLMPADRPLSNKEALVSLYRQMKAEYKRQ